MLDDVRHVAGPGDTAWTAAAREILADFDERSRLILGARVLNGSAAKSTLAELGDLLDLSRERVRQLERLATLKLDSILQLEAAAPIKARARSLREELGPIFTEDEARSHLGLADSPEGELMLQLLLLAGGPFRHIQERLIAPEFEDVVLKKLPGIVASERPAEESLQIVLRDLDVQEQHIDWVIAQIPDTKTVEGHLIPWGGTLADKAFVVLQDHGTTMTLEEVIGALEEGSRGTLGNYFSTDSRFTRRGPKKWGLTEWGGDAWKNLYTAISEEIRDAGGSIPLDALTRRVGERFEVGRNSVVIMATTHPLFIVEGSWVRARRDDEPYVPNCAIDEVGTCVLVDDAWCWRCEVDHDVLRGSGLLIPEAVAAIVGLQPQAKLTFDSPFGAIPLTWPSQNPSIGSLRRVAEQLGAEGGDLLFVHFEDARLAFHLVRLEQLRQASPSDELLLRLGQEPPFEQWQQECANAVGLPAHASRPEIEELLEVRNDRDVLRLFISATHGEARSAS